MKRYYICAADLHIRTNRPQFRTDDYFLTILSKLRQVVKLCNKHKATLIVAGDIFDNIKVGHKVVNVVIKVLKRLEGECLVVAGQHDMSFHTLDLSGSPLMTLVHTGRVRLLQNAFPYGGVSGCSFGVEPIVMEKQLGILVIHKSITPSEPPFFLTEAISAKDAFRKYKDYQFIVSGDYHIPFVKKLKNRILINCGSMMRSSIDQVEHTPRVYLLDTEKVRTKALYLDIADADKVFALELAKKADESLFSEELNGLVETLKDKKNRPDFFQVVKLLVKDGCISKPLENKIKELLGEVTDG